MISSDDTRNMLDHFNSQVAIENLSEDYTMSQHFRIEQWMARGFTKDDLALVIRYMRYRIRLGKREKESLLLRNLISNPDEFSENLSMARSWSRAPKGHTDKAQVLKASGMSNTVDSEAKSAGQVLRAAKAFEAFREAAKNL